MRTVRCLILIGVFTCVTCGQGQGRSPVQPPKFRSVAPIADIMKSIVNPLSRTIFESVGAIVTERGIEEIAPKNDREWDAVRSAAKGLAEAGNLLMFESRTRDKEADWLKLSQQLIERSVEAANAAKAGNYLGHP